MPNYRTDDIYKAKLKQFLSDMPREQLETFAFNNHCNFNEYQNGLETLLESNSINKLIKSVKEFSHKVCICIRKIVRNKR